MAEWYAVEYTVGDEKKIREREWQTDAYSAFDIKEEFFTWAGSEYPNLPVNLKKLTWVGRRDDDEEYSHEVDDDDDNEEWDEDE